MPLVFLFTLTIAPFNVPILRHDWTWPIDRDSAFPFLLSALNGWNPTGIGAPAPYSTGYVAGIVKASLAILLGPTVALFVYLSLIAITCMSAGLLLGGAFDRPRFVRIALAAICLFNPWVYSKVVAGHLDMVLAYAGLVMLVAFVASRRTALFGMCLAAVFASQQLQFLLLAAAVLALAAIRRKDARYALLATAIIALPAFVGIALNAAYLSQTLYLSIWQSVESISLQDVPLLTGYFAGYSQHAVIPWQIGMWFVILAAAIAFVSTVRSNRMIWVPFVVAVALIAFMSGSKAPWGAAYQWIVTHVRLSALYRELYDLGGALLAAYFTIAASRTRYTPLVGTMLSIGAVALIASWVSYPPDRFFAFASELPPIHVVAPENSRFALLPAFQPMSLKDHGSGVDPDMQVLSGNITPLNSYFSEYPANIALADLEHASTQRARDLGVSFVAARPWLATDEPTIALQRAGLSSDCEHAAASPQYGSGTALKAAPELSIRALPSLCSLCTDLDAGNVSVAGLIAVRAQSNSAQAGIDWIDARLAFPECPAIGQAFGGALTTSSSAVLTVPAARSALVYVKGTLRSVLTGRILHRTTDGYQWIHLESKDTELRCNGFCAVAAVSRTVPAAPLNSARHDETAVRFRAVLPDVAVATIPPLLHSRLLEYKVQYHPAWVALENQSPIHDHVKIDEAFNGWIVPPHAEEATVILVEYAALAQQLLELLAIVVLLSMAAFWSKNRWKPVALDSR